MRSPFARSARILPILPIPKIPIVLPVTSLPMNFFFSHLPAFMDAVAWGIFLVSDIIMARACSAAVTALPSGAFMTMMPFFDADGISTLSRPIPARPTIRNFPAASTISFVTLVALLIISPSYWGRIFFNSSGESPTFTSTSTPASLSTSTPTGARLSLIKTFMVFLRLNS